MKKDKIENKDQPQDKSKPVKKSTYSKKKKAQKNVLNGIAYVQSTFKVFIPTSKALAAAESAATWAA